MEIFVSVLVGVLGAAATIAAAFIQTHRTNLHSAREMKSLNRQIKVAKGELERPDTIDIKRSDIESDQMLTIQAREAFFEDLGCDPKDGELLLFHRKGHFKLPYNRVENWVKGWIIVTDDRVICRKSSTIYESINPRYDMHSGVIMHSYEIKASRVRIQNKNIILVEPSNVKQVFICVSTGFFEPELVIANNLVAIIRSIAREPLGIRHLPPFIPEGFDSERYER